MFVKYLFKILIDLWLLLIQKMVNLQYSEAKCQSGFHKFFYQ